MAGDDECDEENDGWTDAETDAETDAGGGGVIGKKEIAIISKIVAAAVLEYQDQQEYQPEDNISQYQDEDSQYQEEDNFEYQDEDNFEYQDEDEEGEDFNEVNEREYEWADGEWERYLFWVGMEPSSMHALRALHFTEWIGMRMKSDNPVSVVVIAQIVQNI